MNEALKCILQYGIERIEPEPDNGQDTIDREEFFNYLYNEDYFIIGTYQAEKFLEKYGVWDAIREVRDYEKDNFGEVTTDLSNPELLANMLAYVKGRAFLEECPTFTDYDKDEFTVEDIMKIQSELVMQIRV